MVAGNRGRAEGEGVGVVLKGSSGIPHGDGNVPCDWCVNVLCTSEKLRGANAVTQTKVKTRNLKVSGTTRNACSGCDCFVKCSPWGKLKHCTLNFVLFL